jgi:hypothetical protein
MDQGAISQDAAPCQRMALKGRKVGLPETGFLEFPSSYGRTMPKTAEAVRQRETRSIWEMARASKLTHYRLNQTAVSPPSTVKMPPTQ